MTIAARRRPDFRHGKRSIIGAGLTPTAVDMALVLAIDVSGSISQDRLQMQIQGYADALRHPNFLAAVNTGRLGRIGLTFVEWSEVRRQTQAVGWRVIANTADRDAFVAALLEAERQMPGWTSISAAIDYSVGLLARSGLVAERRVIDISGDGANNDGRPVTAARDDAVAAGITINGLPITEVEPDLAAYYRANVIGGPDSFLLVADSIRSFAAAILRKLLVEVAGGPVERIIG
jgi:hypothetical protein